MLLLEAARSLQECLDEAEPENPGDVVVKVTVPDRASAADGHLRGEQEAATPKPMTNGDRIRAMTDEELADSEFCKAICEDIPRCLFGGVDTCRECRIKWLGSPVKEENDE